MTEKKSSEIKDEAEFQWGANVPRGPEERFIYDYDGMEVVEVVGQDEEGNLRLSSGATMRSSDVGHHRFSTSPLHALYRAREQFLQGEYQAMMDLAAYEGQGGEGTPEFETLAWARENRAALDRAIEARTRS